MNYFKNIHSLDELKEQFKELARKNHPDAGGDEDVMKQINQEYDTLFPIWKHRYNASASKPTDETAYSTRSQFYTQNGWEGEKHDWNRDIKDVAALIRSYVKEVYPTYKFGVRIQRYSMGQTLYTELKEAPHDIYKTREELTNEDLNVIYRKLKANSYYSGDELGGEEFEAALQKAWNESNFYKVYNELTQAIINDVEREVKSYNYEDIDSMIDYFHVDFHYFGVKIASDFKIVEKQARVKSKENSVKNTTQNMQNQEANENERYQIEKSKHTKTGEDIYLVKIIDTLERKDFLQEKQKMKELGGYYSKYTHSFVFKEDPSNKLNKNSLNNQKNVSTQENMSEEDIYNYIFEYEMLINMPTEERLTLSQRGKGWNLEKVNGNIKDYSEYARNCEKYLKDNLFQINTCEEVSYYLLFDLAEYHAHPHDTVQGVKIERSDTNSITFEVSGYEHDDGSHEPYSEKKTWTLDQINKDLKSICLTHYWKDKKIKYLKEENQIKMIGKLEDKFEIPENDRLTQRYRSPYEDADSNKNKSPDEVGYVLRTYADTTGIEKRYRHLTDINYKYKKIEGIELRNFAYDEENYLHFSTVVDNFELEGLYRIHAPENGDDMKIVSIDYGYQHPKIKEQWHNIEKFLGEYCAEKYANIKKIDESEKLQQDDKTTLVGDSYDGINNKRILSEEELSILDAPHSIEEELAEQSEIQLANDLFVVNAKKGLLSETHKLISNGYSYEELQFMLSDSENPNLRKEYPFLEEVYNLNLAGYSYEDIYLLIRSDAINNIKSPMQDKNRINQILEVCREIPEPYKGTPGDNDTLLRRGEAEIALELGIPIYAVSIVEGYHGSDAGFHTIKKIESKEELIHYTDILSEYRNMAILQPNYPKESQQIIENYLSNAYEQRLIDRIHEVGKLEEQYNVPNDERITQWYGDYNMYEIRSGITPSIIDTRYEQLLQQKNEFVRKEFVPSISFDEWYPQNGYDKALMPREQDLAEFAGGRFKPHTKRSFNTLKATKKRLDYRNQAYKEYEKQIKTGAIPSIEKNVPLDLSTESDRAYCRMQIKKAYSKGDAETANKWKNFYASAPQPKIAKTI